MSVESYLFKMLILNKFEANFNHPLDGNMFHGSLGVSLKKGMQSANDFPTNALKANNLEHELVQRYLINVVLLAVTNRITLL